MAVIPLNIKNSNHLTSICLITPEYDSTNEEMIVVSINPYTHELWYQKGNECFPFDCLSPDCIAQIYQQIRKDPEAWETLKDLEIYEATEVYTKVAYGEITPSMMMQFMN